MPAVLTSYSITAWTQKRGPLAGRVSVLAEDRDGYLWISGDGVLGGPLAWRGPT
jgi:hypothetical protein